MKGCIETMKKTLDVLDEFGFSPTNVKDRVKDWADDDFGYNCTTFVRFDNGDDSQSREYEV